MNISSKVVLYVVISLLIKFDFIYFHVCLWILFFSIFISSLNFTSIQSYFLITIKITIRVIIKYNIRIVIEIIIIENYNCQNCCYLNHYKNHLYKNYYNGHYNWKYYYYFHWYFENSLKMKTIIVCLTKGTYNWIWILCLTLKHLFINRIIGEHLLIDRYKLFSKTIYNFHG